jgi:hypothetical protein
MANEAVDQARKTNDRVGELSKAAARIGDVVELINTIAGQTDADPLVRGTSQVSGMRKLIRRHMPQNDCTITLALIAFTAYENETQQEA